MKKQCFLVRLETTICIQSDSPQAAEDAVACMSPAQITEDCGHTQVIDSRKVTSLAEIPDDLLCKHPIHSDTDSVEGLFLPSK